MCSFLEIFEQTQIDVVVKRHIAWQGDLGEKIS